MEIFLLIVGVVVVLWAVAAANRPKPKSGLIVVPVAKKQGCGLLIAVVLGTLATATAALAASL
jgi:hypothetical protein